MALSSREQKVLAALEEDLRGQDPDLVDLFTTRDRTRQWPPRLPIPVRYLGWLIGALLALIIIQVGAGGLGLLGTAALTGGLIIAWLAATAWATRHRPRGLARKHGRKPDRGTSTHGPAAPDRRHDGDDGLCSA